MKNLKSGYGTALSWLAGQARRCVEDGQGGSDNLRKQLPHRRRRGASRPYGAPPRGANSPGAGPPLGRGGAEKEEASLSLGASSLLGPRGICPQWRSCGAASAASHSIQPLKSASGPVRWRPQKLCRLLGDPFRLSDLSHIAPTHVAALVVSQRFQRKISVP